LQNNKKINLKSILLFTNYKELLKHGLVNSIVKNPENFSKYNAKTFADYCLPLPGNRKKHISFTYDANDHVYSESNSV